MAQTAKLTVRVEKQWLEAAKRYAALHNVTLSRLIGEYLRLIATQQDAFSETPILHRSTGILPSDVSTDEYKAHLAGKYGF